MSTTKSWSPYIFIKSNYLCGFPVHFLPKEFLSSPLFSLYVSTRQIYSLKTHDIVARLHTVIHTNQKFVIYETSVMGDYSSESESFWPAKLRNMLLPTHRYPSFRKNRRSQSVSHLDPSITFNIRHMMSEKSLLTGLRS